MRPIWIALIAGTVGSLSSVGCSAPTDPDPIELDVVVVDSATVEVDLNRVSGSVFARIRNVTQTPIWYNQCNVEVQREADGAWVTVWSQMCLLAHRELPEIPPGEELAVRIQLHGSVGDDGLFPRWPDPIEGVYRLRVGILRPPGVLPEGALTSRPFEVGS